MHDSSHVSSLATRPNANTRLAATGPRLESVWLDEAYARARAIEAPPMTAPGYRVVWWRGAEIGRHDLVAHPAAFAVVGRHTCCDVVLPSDPEIALRHLLVRVTTLDDGSTALRVLDLRSGAGFHLDDDAERRAIVASGPVAIRIGRYALVGLPSCTDLPAQRPRATIVDAPSLPTAAPRRHRSYVTTLPPVPWLEDVARHAASPGCARVTLRRGPAWTSVEPTDAVLDAGVLVGRADKCERGLRSVLTPAVSRVHVLLLREHGVVHAFDVASTQGTWAGDERVRRVRLPDGGGTLRLASTDPVWLEWHPRARVA